MDLLRPSRLPGGLLVAAALSFALASCAGSGKAAIERAHTYPTDRRAAWDTCPQPVCPPQLPCPAPPDPRHFGLPSGIDTLLWVRLDSLTHLLHDPTGGVLGAHVVRTRDSSVVWSHHPDLRTLPASTMKVLTTMAALEDLGPEYRWQTRVWATGPVQGGILKGDLILEGGGDPTLGVDGSGMGPLVNAVSRAGIRSVQGRLIALDTIVGRERDVWPQGWTFGNSRDGYGAPVAGLNWGQNRAGKRALAEPRRLALMVFSKSLAARKIKVGGSDTTIWARGDTSLDRRRWDLLGKTASPRLSEVMRICLIHSVNPYAEAAVLAMGLRRPNPKFSPREQGKRRFRQILSTLGAPGSVTADDGSGLSRYDLVTARAMTELLRRDLGRAQGLRATDLMAVGGQGTLRHRFGRLPSRQMVSAKTGTLDGTCTLVGLLRVPGRDTLAFAFLSTGYQGGSSRIRGFQDRLLMSLAGVDTTPTLSPVMDSFLPEEEDEPTPDFAPASPSTPLPDSVPTLPETGAGAPDTAIAVPPVLPDPPAPESDTLAPRIPDTSTTPATLGPPPSDSLAPLEGPTAPAVDTGADKNLQDSTIPPPAETFPPPPPEPPPMPPDGYTPPPTPPDLGPMGAPPPPPPDVPGPPAETPQAASPPADSSLPSLPPSPPPPGPGDLIVSPQDNQVPTAPGSGPTDSASGTTTGTAPDGAQP